MFREKRKRSDSVLWQKPLYQQKCQTGKVTTQTRCQKITQGLLADLSRSVWVTTATQLVWFTGFTGPTVPLTINKWENKSEIDDVCVFRVNAPTNWRRQHWLLIVWDIFAFSSAYMTKLARGSTQFPLQNCIRVDRYTKMAAMAFEWHCSFATTQKIETKAKRKQVLTVFYQVNIFRSNLATKLATLVSDWPTHFLFLRVLHRVYCTDFDEIGVEVITQLPLPHMRFWVDPQKKKWPPWPRFG